MSNRFLSLPIRRLALPTLFFLSPVVNFFENIFFSFGSSSNFEKRLQLPREEDETQNRTILVVAQKKGGPIPKPTRNQFLSSRLTTSVEKFFVDLGFFFFCGTDKIKCETID